MATNTGSSLINTCAHYQKRVWQTLFIIDKMYSLRIFRDCLLRRTTHFKNVFTIHTTTTLNNDTTRDFVLTLVILEMSSWRWFSRVALFLAMKCRTVLVLTIPPVRRQGRGMLVRRRLLSPQLFFSLACRSIFSKGMILLFKCLLRDFCRVPPFSNALGRICACGSMGLFWQYLNTKWSNNNFEWFLCYWRDVAAVAKSCLF